MVNFICFMYEKILYFFFFWRAIIIHGFYALGRSPLLFPVRLHSVFGSLICLMGLGTFMVDEREDSRAPNFDLVYTLNNQAMFPSIASITRLCLVSFTSFEEEKISGFNSSLADTTLTRLSVYWLWIEKR